MQKGSGSWPLVLGYLISPKIPTGKMPMHKSPEFRLGKTQVVENCAVRRLVVLEKHAHDLVVGMRNAPVIPTCSPRRPFSMSKRLS